MPSLSAGAEEGLASEFNAHFAGIIFVVEEMHSQFKYNFYSIAAIMVACGTADLVVRLLIAWHISIFMVPYIPVRHGLIHWGVLLTNHWRMSGQGKKDMTSVKKLPARLLAVMVVTTWIFALAVVVGWQYT